MANFLHRAIKQQNSNDKYYYQGVMSGLSHVAVSKSNIPDGCLEDGGSRNSAFPLACQGPQAPFFGTRK